MSANMDFLGQFLRTPARVGSICPSSRFLARALVNMAMDSNVRDGLIIDLGAGSGVVSRQLLRHGIGSERILALDISERFNDPFHKHCPNLMLYNEDAGNVSRIIASDFPRYPVQAIISSLPLRNMPNRVVARIMGELRRLLVRDGGILIQYTYALWLHSSLVPYGFACLDRQYVPLNIPPALVEKYRPA